jgi:hypothetical protein
MERTNPAAAGAADAIEELEGEEVSIDIDVTEDNEVWLHGPDWELFLSPEEARMLGQALIDAAADAEGPTE